MILLLFFSVLLSDFGGFPNDGRPDDEAMSKAISEAIVLSYPNYRQEAIELEAGKYEFEKPIEWLVGKSYNPSVQIVGRGASYGHPAYDSTVLEFKHDDSRPCIRLTGNAARLERLCVLASPNAYCAIELGNDAWPGRVQEADFGGDKSCNRSLLRDVATWGGNVGVSVRTWGTTTLDRVKVQKSSEIGIRLAGNSITLNDCYIQPQGVGICVEFGECIAIRGGAIENTFRNNSGGKRETIAVAGVSILKGSAVSIDTVYFENMPVAIDATDCDGLSVRGLRSGSVVSPYSKILVRGTSEFCKGVTVQTKRCNNVDISACGAEKYGIQLHKDIDSLLTPGDS